jgi:hypothetical protein
MRRAFIVSPYRADDDHSVAQHEHIAHRLCKYARNRGYTPVAPHLLFPKILDDGISEERELGMWMGLQLMPWCDVVLVYASHTMTKGMWREVQRAYDLPMRVEEVSEWDMQGL